MRDVNDTGFTLVLGRSDWHEQFGVGTSPSEGEGDSPANVVYVSEERCAALRSRIDRFPRRPGEPAFGPDDRTSVARDRYGSWYWIDPRDPTRILVRNAGDGLVESFWSSEDPGEKGADRPSSGSKTASFEPVDGSSMAVSQPLGGLTITTDHRLVVGARSPNQLLLFDLHAGGPPARISWFGGEEFAPLDAAPRVDGGVYLLDRPSDSDVRLWVLDRTFRPVGPPGPESSNDVFRPADGDGAEGGEGSSASVEPISLPADLRPQRLLTLPDDTILILSVSADEGEGYDSTIYRYRVFDTETGAPIPMGSADLDALVQPEGEEEEARWTRWRAHDIAFVPGTPSATESIRGRLYVVGADGNQAYALSLVGDADGITADLVPEYVPLRHFSGKGLVEAEGQVYYDKGERWLPLTAQRRPRYVDRGRVQSAPFDSEVAACTWHRLFLDACIPADTTVRVESRASDHIDQLPDQPWQPEPELYRRDTGAEIPYYEPFPSSENGPDRRGTWELLLQRARGRYLQLRVTLEGNGRASPQLYSLRLYSPRFSYLDEYMPDLYQENEASAWFLERFLANAEGMLTSIEGKIAEVQALFDVRTIPSEYLDWLGRWFGTTFDPALDSRRKRLFLEHAVQLYNERGTLAGLARMLTLVLDPCVDESLFTAAGVARAVGRPRDASARVNRRYGVRLIESFAARDVPRAVLGDATTPEQPVEVRVDQQWTPADGAETLHRRFRSFLQTERYERADERIDAWGEHPAFPPLQPDENPRRGDWDVFVRRYIKGPYAAIRAESVVDEAGDGADAVTQRFRSFLQRRYRSFDQLPGVWQRDAEGLASITLPRELPSGPALRDWIHFAGAALPIHRAAHRFRVLVPVDPDAEVARQRQRLSLARRVVEREKPAHTAFDVVPYWAAFRVGAVRTGLDTVLGAGSRYSPLLVGDGVLAETTVGAEHPMGQPDRRVTGRDAPGDPRPL